MLVKIHRRLAWQQGKDGFWTAEAGPFTLRLHQPSRVLLVTLTERPVIGDADDDVGDLLAMAEDATRNAMIDGDTAIITSPPGRTFID